MKKIYLHIIILVILSSLLRFIFLDRTPIGISGDELDYVLNAKAVALTGKDISGLWSPFSLSTPPHEVPKAELPYLFVTPFMKFLPLNLLSARLPYAFFSVLFVVLIYLIGRRLFSSSQAFIIGLIAAINPWFIYFGRTAFDAPLAVYLYFLAFYILLKLKKNKIFIAFPFFFFAFFSYIGTKIIYLPFLFISVFYVWNRNKKRDTKKYVLFTLLCLIPFLFFVITLSQRPAVFRISDLSSFNRPEIARAVDEERKLSIQTPLTLIFSNKLFVFFKQLVNNYLGSFSENYLFLYGENSPFISLWYHGIFYYIDSIFLLIGLCALFKKNPKIFLLFLAIILIAPIPSMASVVGISYSIRASLMFPVMVFIIGYGISYVLSFYKSFTYKITISCFISGLYLLLLLNFLNILLFRNPIYASETFGFSGREVVKYILLAEKENKNVIFLNKPSEFIPYFFKQYLFYSDGYKITNARQISKIIKSGNYSINNFRISDCRENIDKNSIIIAEPDSKCATLSKFNHPLSISRLADGGTIYKIYNDDICSKYKLERYPSSISLNDLQIEKLSEKQFCETFISDL
ncbi:MAG: glycosyltransferase family 39 protein [Patescibacteria group bacterium]|nr:glycosyltransferase family 39 protein [Patescibacteria group bacterium]